MMKDIFPFSQLGHALTHHYPIELIHGFPSASPGLPHPSTHKHTRTHTSVHLPVDPCMLFPNSPLNRPRQRIPFKSLYALYPLLVPSTLPSFFAISFSSNNSHTFNVRHPSQHSLPFLLYHPLSLSFLLRTFCKSPRRCQLTTPLSATCTLAHARQHK